MSRREMALRNHRRYPESIAEQICSGVSGRYAVPGSIEHHARQFIECSDHAASEWQTIVTPDLTFHIAPAGLEQQTYVTVTPHTFRRQGPCPPIVTISTAPGGFQVVGVAEAAPLSGVELSHHATSQPLSKAVAATRKRRKPATQRERQTAREEGSLIYARSKSHEIRLHEIRLR